MDGGRVYGKGKKGKVYDVACVDTKSLCYDIVSSPDKSLIVYTTDDSRIRIPQEYIPYFIHLLANRMDLVVKRFPGTKQGHRTFLNELDGIRHLFGMYGSGVKHYIALEPLRFQYTIKSTSRLKLLSIIGFEYGEDYYIFNTRCENDLTSMIEIITNKQVNQMIYSLLESLVVLQKHGWSHNDIKFDNVMVCNDTFKFIDWERALPLSELHHRLLVRGDYEKPYGSRFFTFPLEQYIYTDEFTGASYSEAITFGIFRYSKKIPFTMKDFSTYWKFYESKCVQPVKEFVHTTKQTKKQLVERYIKSFDVFSVGILVAILAHIRNLPHKYLEFAETLVNIQHPRFAFTAVDALRVAREILK